MMVGAADNGLNKNGEYVTFCFAVVVMQNGEERDG
jgi:hypothetical protein